MWHTVARHWSKGCIPYLTIAFSRRPPSVCLSITQQVGVRMSMGKFVIVSDCYNIKVPRLAPVKFTHKRPFKNSQMAFLAVDKRLHIAVSIHWSMCQSVYWLSITFYEFWPIFLSLSLPNCPQLLCESYLVFRRHALQTWPWQKKDNNLKLHIC